MRYIVSMAGCYNTLIFEARVSDKNMNNSAKIAVIIPNFNRKDIIIKTLDYVKAQTFSPHCLIIVDDASTDGSKQTINAWIKENDIPFKVMLLVNKENMGAPTSRNRGLQHIEDCEFVYFLDSDDYPPASFLEKAAAKMISDPELVAASSDRIMCYEDSQETIKQAAISNNPWEWFLRNGAGIASCTLFRADAIKELNGFNPTLPTGHDTELFTRLANMGKWGYIADCPVSFLHRKQGHLRSKYYDYLRRWALIYENCLNNFGGRKHISRDTYGTLLAARWFIAGVQLLQQNKINEANDCFRKSMSWKLKKNWAFMFLFVLSPALKILPASDTILRIMSSSKLTKSIFGKGISRGP